MERLKIIILTILIFNCAKTSYYIKDTNSDIRMSGFLEQEGYTIDKRFEVSSTRVQMFWGLEEVELDLETILKEENIYNSENKDKAIGGLTITEEYGFLNSLLDLFTVGLFRPYSVEIEGWIYTKTNKPIKTPKPIKGKR